MSGKRAESGDLFEPKLGENDLLATACALGADRVGGWSDAETSIVCELPAVDNALVRAFSNDIRAGMDPLGEAFCALRSRERRREMGATYTPFAIVGAMVDWCARLSTPERVVDPGCGSGRFLLAAGTRFPQARLVGVEVDPVAAILARANLAARGLAKRSAIVLADFRDVRLDDCAGKTLFIGNPPYVRHHQIGARWKAWLTSLAQRLALPVSQLCGLHVYFYLATVALGKEGDFGAYITAAEWLDVNYGQLLRRLSIERLGLQSLALVEPTAQPFPDATTTASIASFVLGEAPKSVSFYRVRDTASLGQLPEPRQVPVHCLKTEQRWTVFTRPAQRRQAGCVELGELCRVHRGQVTGANRVWIVNRAVDLHERYLLPCVTRAKELFAAGRRLTDSSHLRRVVDLPLDLDALSVDDRRRVEAFLRLARHQGADRGYVAEKRRAWWSVGLRAPAPILCT